MKTQHTMTLVLLLLLGAVVPAQAQNVINPRYLEFTASVDHDVTQGTPPVNLVTRYDVQWFQGGTLPIQTDALGKPTPDASRLIRLDLSTVIMGLPFGTGFTAKVVSVGPGGQGVSAASNPFDTAPRAPAEPTNARLSR